MATCVIDVNVCVKWRVPEALAGEASLLLERDDLPLLAPSFLLVEANNVFATKVRGGEIPSDIASEFLLTLGSMVNLTPDERLLPTAFSISTTHAASVYDSLYV